MANANLQQEEIDALTAITRQLEAKNEALDEADRRHDEDQHLLKVAAMELAHLRQELKARDEVLSLFRDALQQWDAQRRDVAPQEPATAVLHKPTDKSALADSFIL